MRLRRDRLAVSVAVAIAVCLFAASALAAQSPFGIATPDGGGGGFGGPLGPVFFWIAQRQREFYQSLTAALSSFKDSGAAVWALLGLSFFYGIFHAAGPGHGKVVISSYLVASGETVRRGIAIAFAAAFVQAVTAVVVVGIAAAILNVTAQTMTAATDWLEIGSYALVAAVGAWLLWSKTVGGGHHHHHHHHHHVPVADTRQPRHDHHDHEHGHRHDHDDGHHHHDHCQALAAAAPAAATSGNPLAKAWSAILGVGIRPCSGAIIILVFALSQGLFIAGVAATFVMAVGTGITVAALATLAVSAKGVAARLAGGESETGHRVLRAIEIAGALAVLLLGLLLLGGALSARFSG
ncbi:nickel/cobalt transporter [Bauldia sp.]|uniref:nickel/cobalt transporter n=1 Tax=Bauldia sp. TaxID=2575872 RepID=UPI0025C3B1B0|nr:nickel/cobalt transporter [Bauldia sp.]